MKTEQEIKAEIERKTRVILAVTEEFKDQKNPRCVEQDSYWIEALNWVLMGKEIIDEDIGD